MRPVWKRLLIGAAIIFVAAPLAKYVLSPSEKQQEEGWRERSTLVGAEAQTIISRQDSEGVQNSDVNVDFANAVGEHTLSRIKFHTEKALDRMDSKESTESLRQETVLLDSEGLNIIVTRIFLGRQNTSVQFAAIRGSELTRVMCQSPDWSKDIVLAGKCSEEVANQFGIDLGGFS